MAFQPYRRNPINTNVSHDDLFINISDTHNTKNKGKLRLFLPFFLIFSILLTLYIWVIKSTDVIEFPEQDCHFAETSNGICYDGYCYHEDL